MRSDFLRPFLAGSICSLGVLGGVYLGSVRYEHFDPALRWYAVGTALAAFATAFRLMLWVQRPPSRIYYQRAVELLLRGKVGLFRGDKSKVLGQAVASQMVAQNFIRHRSVYRWIMHLCLSGGCTLAFAITFPLVFGWVHFESSPVDPGLYQVKAFGIWAGNARIHGFGGFLLFNALNISAVLVLIGLIMACWRRLTDAGERATQSFREDFLPLIMIFAVTATGLALTVSYKFLQGRGHSTLAFIHMVTVIALLFYLPFSKLLHIFQRTCSLCVTLYKRAGKNLPAAPCLRCGSSFASQMHIEDLKKVLGELKMDYSFASPRGEIHYQQVCPPCRRRVMGLSHGQTLGR